MVAVIGALQTTEPVVGVQVMPIVDETDDTAPLPEPQSEPVPLSTPEVLTCKHWVEPVIDPKVGAVLKVCPSVQVLAVLNSGIVAPEVPIAVVDAEVKAEPLVLVQVTAPPDVAVQSPLVRLYMYVAI